MPLFDLPATREAKFFLSFCYRNGIIGRYRRHQSAWEVRFGDKELTLDDLETVRFLKDRIRCCPQLTQQLEQEWLARSPTAAPSALHTRANPMRRPDV